MAPIPSVVEKRDGTEVPFERSKIMGALNKTFISTTNEEASFSVLNSLTDKVVKKLPTGKVKRDDIDKAVIETLKENPKYFPQASEYETFSQRRKAAKQIKVLGNGTTNSTDLNLLIEGHNDTELESFDPSKIYSHLERQDIQDLTPDKINILSKKVEMDILEAYERRKGDGENFIINTEIIKSIVGFRMFTMGIDPSVILKTGNYGLGSEDIAQLIFSKTEENSNVGTNNPEAVALGIWETIQKKYATNEVFSKELKEAHLKGKLHIHDLGYITRVYCSGHSPAYIKKYGLKLDNLSTESAPPKHAVALSGLISTFLASMQAYYAGALGLSYLNLEFAPYVENMDKENIKEMMSGIKGFLNDNSDKKAGLESLLHNYFDMTDKVVEMSKSDIESDEAISIFEAATGKLRNKQLELQLNKLKEEYVKIKNGVKDLSTYVENREELSDLVNQIGTMLEGDEKLYGNFEDVMSKFADMKQLAQNLIFTQSQSAFSRGGQTLFIDFNLHTEVPDLLKDIPIVCPGGVYRICDSGKRAKYGETPNIEDLIRVKDVNSKDGLIFKDSDGDVIVDGEGNFNRELLKQKGKRLVTYKDYEKEAQDFLDALLDVYHDGDSNGKMFAFPKCDIHVGEESYKNERSQELLKKACKVSAHNSSVYFMFDRDAVSMAACCRLKAAIDPKALEHPESLRFCGFQNVTINLPQAAMRAIEGGKKNLDGLIDEVLDTMDLAYQAHIQRREFVESLMHKPGLPLWQIGKPSLDGDPYVDLDKATYIIGMLGLNEAIQLIAGQELHESEEALQMGERVIAAMYKRKQTYVEQKGWKFSIEESPAESAARNLSKRDLNHPVYGKYAKEVIQGTEKDPYYTNSVHFRADAEGVTGIDRVKKLARFHPMIESGAIVHLFTGESEINPDALYDAIQNIYETTQCTQVTVSGAHTSCRKCGRQSRGLLEMCDFCNSNDVSHTEKVVGYNSTIENWNDSKKEEAKARERGNYSIGTNLLSLDDHIKLDPEQPLIKAVIYGKKNCGWCEDLKVLVEKVVEENYKGQIIVEKIEINSGNGTAYEDLARAARNGVNFGQVPSLGIEFAQQDLNIPLDGVVTIGTKGEVYRSKQTLDLKMNYDFIKEPKIKKLLEEALEASKDYVSRELALVEN